MIRHIIKQYNQNGEPHGYWERYRKQNGTRWFRGNFFNGKKIGRWHWYNEYGKLSKIEYYL